MKKRRGDGEGSVFKLGATGKWRAQLPHYAKDGSRHFTTKAFTTKGAADAWITAHRHDRYEGVAVAPDKQSVAAYMESWLEIQKKAVRPKTHRTYSDFVNLHITPDLGKTRLQNLSTIQVKQWLFSKSPKYSTRTIQHLRDTLRGALNSAVKAKLLKHNPVLDIDKLPATRKTATDMREPMTQEEAKAILGAASEHRESALLRTILTLGLRKGEALALKLQDINLATDPPTLSVRQSLQAVGAKLMLGPAKTDGSERELPLSPGLAEALRAHLDRRGATRRKARTKDLWVETDYLFVTRHGAPIYPRNLNRDLTKMLAGAGIRHFTVHDFRHAAATLALADNVPAPYIAAMLGHTSVRTTLAMYANKALPKVLVHATSTMDRILAGDGS